jgi:hypothetical protein
MSGPDLRIVGGVLAQPTDAPIEDGGGGEGGPRLTMPDGCPVEPLGTEDNQYYFLTSLGELRELTAEKVSNKNIVGMFSPNTDYLYATWPRRTQVPIRIDGKLAKDAEGNNLTEWVTTGWRVDDVSVLLIKVCGNRGVWSPHEKVRGRGAWRGEDGGLIYHRGNKVLINGAWRDPGQFDGLVYPTAPAIPPPSPEAVDNSLPDELHKLLEKWAWLRPEIDASLFLGWIGAAMFGGALDHRPVVWVTGDKATGKTSLERLLIGVMDGALLQSSNATEAAVRQLLGQQSLPVSIDEAEADEDNRKTLNIVNLARVAATGGRIHRGGQDHTGVEFQARSCFKFSSILLPPLGAADRSRLALLELGKLPAGSREPKVSAQAMREIGAAMRRRFIDGWGRFPKVLELYRDALIDLGGHSGRSADVFATLVAVQFVLLNDGLPDEHSLAFWASKLNIATLAEAADDDSEAQRCMAWLGSSTVQLSGHGTPRLVSDWVRQACGDPKDEEMSGARTALDMLAKIGLGLAVPRRRAEGEVVPPGRPVPGRRYLVVANCHQGLAQQFEGSHWKGKSGAPVILANAWTQTPGAVRNEVQRIGGVATRCTLVPIEAMWGDALPTDDQVAVEAETVDA